MKKIYSLYVLVTIFFVACAPQVTATPEVIVTLPPASPALEATSTPEPTTTPTAETVSAAMQQTTALLEKYSVDPETVTVTEEGGAVNVTYNDTGKVLIRTIGEMSKYDLAFAVNTVAANSCESTDIKPKRNGDISSELHVEFNQYREVLLRETNFLKGAREGTRVYHLLVDRQKQCWAFTDGQKLGFRDGIGEVHLLTLFEATIDEIIAIKYSK